ncbi:MAG: acyl-CoA thioesterase [Clostridiales bacterium]|nr:acyl-CoA thioesterase [Clostridiales bacterium]
MRSDCIFFCPVRVRYGEVDQQGVVYNGNYVVYTDVAFEEFLRSKGYSYKKLVNEYASEVCHKKATFEYISSAFEGDMLEIGVRVIRVGNRSFTLGFEIYRQEEEGPLVTSEIVYVGYDTERRTSRPITGLMRKILGA